MFWTYEKYLDMEATQDPYYERKESEPIKRSPCKIKPIHRVKSYNVFKGFKFNEKEIGMILLIFHNFC